MLGYYWATTYWPDKGFFYWPTNYWRIATVKYYVNKALFTLRIVLERRVSLGR